MITTLSNNKTSYTCFLRRINFKCSVVAGACSVVYGVKRDRGNKNLGDDNKSKRQHTLQTVHAVGVENRSRYSSAQDRCEDGRDANFFLPATTSTPKSGELMTLSRPISLVTHALLFPFTFFRIMCGHPFLSKKAPQFIYFTYPPRGNDTKMMLTCFVGRKTIMNVP